MAKHDDDDISRLLMSDVPSDQMRGMALALGDPSIARAHEGRLRELSKSDEPGMFRMSIGDLAMVCLAFGGLENPDGLGPLARTCLDNLTSKTGQE